MRQVDFYGQTRALQDRFVRCTQGVGMPAPLAFAPERPRDARTWLGVAVGAALLLAIVAIVGMGSLESSLALHGPAMIAAYALLLAAVVFALLRAASIERATNALPFRAGWYLFPSGVVDARTGRLRVLPIAELSPGAPRDPARTIVLAASGETLSFSVRSREEGEKLLASLPELRAEVSRAEAEHAHKALAHVDPLFDDQLATPFGPTAPHADERPAWSRFAWAIALAAGGVAGAGLWDVRNALSDGRMFATASASDDATAYRAYLARGGARRDEVAAVLLPKAELRQAEKRGTVEALETFAREHAGSRIEADIAAALRKAMLGELDAAKRAGTVTALREFAARHPEHRVVEPELRAALHAAFQRSLAAFRAHAASKDEDVPPFVERLLAWSEAHGAAAEIRFRMRPSKTLDDADVVVKKSPYFRGAASLPSRHLDAAHLAPREDRLADALIRGFADVFPRDVLALAKGSAFDGDGAPPEPKVPTLFVEYGAELWSSGFVSRNPRGVYVGMIFPAQLSFRIPGDRGTLKLALSARQAPDVALVKPPDGSDAKVYEALATSAFESLAKKALASFFEPHDGK